MYQLAPNKRHTNPVITINKEPLKTLDKFCLGSTLSCSTTLDDKIAQCLSRCNIYFGMLRKRLWNEHGISLCIKK